MQRCRLYKKNLSVFEEKNKARGVGYESPRQALVICLSYLIHANAPPWLDPFRPESLHFMTWDLGSIVGVPRKQTGILKKRCLTPMPTDADAPDADA